MFINAKNASLKITPGTCYVLNSENDGTKLYIPVQAWTQNF